MPAVSRGLYVHIPFCLKKCHYCDFVITTKRSAEDRSLFLSALESEAENAFKKYGRLLFSTFYLGGGTPSALSAPDMEKLIKIILKRFEFQPGFELTCEVNPGDIDLEKMKCYRSLGINRISLGVQAFQDELLVDMGRPHCVEDIFKTHALLKETGFDNISFDLINGLPNQTLAQFEESLKKTGELEASQLSLYDLDVHEKTVYGLRRREGRLPVPNENTRWEMYQLAQAKMTAAGYHHYEISTFAKPGFESRHNQLYWRNQEYLGLGPGAFSYLNGIRYQFAGDVRHYYEKISAEDWGSDTEDILTEEEKEKETLFTGIRLLEGFDLNQLRVTGKEIEARVNAASSLGLFKINANRLFLTDKGRALAEKSFQCLLGKDC